jgi:hypothetical protein
VDLAVMLADGGQTISDLAVLRQPRAVGAVPRLCPGCQRQRLLPAVGTIGTGWLGATGSHDRHR